MKIQQAAAQLYTLRDSMTTPDDMARTLKAVRAIGYEAVQVSGVGPIAPKALRKLMDDNGLTCCSTHEDAAEILNNTEAIIEKLRTLGSPTTAIPWLGKEHRSGEGFKRFIAATNAACAKMKAAGIDLMYHNHAFEFEKVNGRLLLDVIYSETDLKAEIDTYWVQVGGGNPVDWCKRMAPRMPVVHLKDLAYFDEGGAATAEIGQGNLDFKAIVRACDKGGVKWFAVEQDNCRRPPLESLKMSFDYIKESLCT